MGEGRKGQGVSADYAVAMAVFILTVSVSLYYAYSIIRPTTPGSLQLENIAYVAKDNLEGITEWTVYRVPIFLKSDYGLNNVPIEFNFSFPSYVDVNSPIIQNGSFSEIKSNTNGSEVVFFANLSQGLNRYYLVYTENSTLSWRGYPSSLSRNNYVVSNGDVRLEFNDTGIRSLRFGSEELLNSQANISVSTYPNITNRTIMYKINYSQKEIRLFSDSNIIRFDSASSETYTFNLIHNFDYLYSSKDDFIVYLNETGILYQNDTEFIDVYNSNRGLALIGNMSVTVNNGSALTITVNKQESLELLPHEGDYTQVLTTKNRFYNPENVTIGSIEYLKGLNREYVENLTAWTYKQLRTLLGVGRMYYNITIDNVSVGRSIPNTQVVVYLFKYPLVDRFGNVNASNVSIGVWP